LKFSGRCYRAHDPAWSFNPLSGAGSASTGGRFNRKGEPTLYLSLDVMTSFGECTQGFTKRLPPLTMCEYDVDGEASPTCATMWGGLPTASRKMNSAARGSIFNLREGGALVVGDRSAKGVGPQRDLGSEFRAGSIGGEFQSRALALGAGPTP